MFAAKQLAPITANNFAVMLALDFDSVNR